MCMHVCVHALIECAYVGAHMDYRVQFHGSTSDDILQELVLFYHMDLGK